MSVGFASLHTTVFTATNAVLDLAASPPEQECLEIIRAEVQQVLAEEGGKWTKRGLARMIHLDSAIRESMRLSGIVTRGLGRCVIAKGGVTTPGGIHLPEGASIAVASYGNRFDENMYDHSKNYDAFRYSRQRQTTEQGIEKSTQEILKSKHLAMISPADDFLQFGHSPHPCPGRFFAAAQLKVLLGCMVLNYDIKPLEKRPPGEWINDTILPPLKAKIWVKKRADAL
jgi:cytochrome P450